MRYHMFTETWANSVFSLLLQSVLISAACESLHNEITVYMSLHITQGTDFHSAPTGVCIQLSALARWHELWPTGLQLAIVNYLHIDFQTAACLFLTSNSELSLRDVRLSDTCSRDRPIIAGNSLECHTPVKAMLILQCNSLFIKSLYIFRYNSYNLYKRYSALRHF